MGTQAGITPPTRRALLDLVTAAAAAPTSRARLELLIDGIAAVLDGEVGGFNHIDVHQRRAVVVMRPEVVVGPTEALQAGYRQHPVIHQYRRTLAATPVVLSSCPMGRWRRWQDHPAYSMLFRPMGTPHEIVVPAPGAAPHALRGAGYAVTRSGRDFGDRELAVAAAVQRMLWVLHRSDPKLAAAGRTELLTAAERTVLQLYGMRFTETQIAEHRRCSRATVHTLLRTGCGKLELTGDRHRQLARVFGYCPPAPLPADRLARALDG
jgi:DNA-binding CsgD family transcriptional regulator